MAAVVERPDDDADGHEAEDLERADPTDGRGGAGAARWVRCVVGLEDAEGVDEATGGVLVVMHDWDGMVGVMRVRLIMKLMKVRMVW